MSGPTVAVAVGPSQPQWAVDAVVAGGGEVVPAAQAEALVWLHPRAVGELQAALAAAPGVRWVQLPWAGVEEYAAAGVFEPSRAWTCGKGVYAEPVAEHALTLLLAGYRDIPERVQARAWGRQSGLSLFDRRVVVLGGGGITEALLPMLDPFRCETTVVRRRPVSMAGAARVVGPDALASVLPGADALVVALALTPETTGIVNRSVLRALPEHAWMVNVGRGQHVVTADLVEALTGGWIGGAGLDVTDPEPLPDGHPLWDLPNCIVTPHTANTFEMALPHLQARITENVRRFASGDELVGGVDVDLGY